jgi:hypothetical protein
MKPHGKRIVVVLLSCLVVAACATQPAPRAYDPPSFLLGFVHGFIVFFSLIGSLFWDIRVYAFPNSGFLYDFGFCLGIGSWIGAAKGS